MADSTRAALETELTDLRILIDHEAKGLDHLRQRRDKIILELRTLEDRPSTRALAEIAGVSGPFITQLETKART